MILASSRAIITRANRVTKSTLPVTFNDVET